MTAQLALFASIALVTAGGAILAPHASALVKASLDCPQLATHARAHASAHAHHARAQAQAQGQAGASAACALAPRAPTTPPQHERAAPTTDRDGHPCPDHDDDDDAAADGPPSEAAPAAEASISVDATVHAA